MTVAAAQNEHSDLGAMEDLSDLGSQRSGNTVNVTGYNAAKGSSRGQVGSNTYRADSYRSRRESQRSMGNNSYVNYDISKSGTLVNNLPRPKLLSPKNELNLDMLEDYPMAVTVDKTIGPISQLEHSNQSHH